MDKPKTAESFDQAFGIYNPGALSPEILLNHFIARKHKLSRALDIVRNNQPGESQQHLLVIGPRGMGKTMLLLALAYSVQNDPELSEEWVPVIFPEETYGIGDLADFWLSMTEHLLSSINQEIALSEVDALREKNPEDIELQAQALFLRHLNQSGRRALVVLENLHDFFDSVSDPAEQHRLRAFLMDNDRVMIAASSPTYFDATGQMEMPFYDFFRIMRLERFTRDEMLEVFHQLAKQRGDTQVETILKTQPERIDSLRVLTGGNPRLVKMVYRLLSEGGTGSARQDLDRLIEDCTPYFKHRIEELKGEVRRVFDHVAKQWDPVAVGDIQVALRRPSNKISIYLRRLMDEGFLEEAAGSTPKRKMYQVAERFYNIYYLMRFSRSGKRRLTWLVQAMRVLYSEADFKTWAERTLDSWKNSTESGARSDHEAFLYSLTRASDCVGLQGDLVEKTIETAWNEDQMECLNKLLDQELAHEALGDTFDLIAFFASLPAKEKKGLGYEPKNAWWWQQLAQTLEEKNLYDSAVHACAEAIKLKPDDADLWFNYGFYLDADNKHEKSAEAYRKSLAIKPKNFASLNNLGHLLFHHLDQAKEAEELFRVSINFYPNFALPYANLSVLLGTTNRLAEAEDMALRAVLLSPLVTLGRSCFIAFCNDKTSAWLQALPVTLKELRSEPIPRDTGNPAETLYSFAIHGLEVLLSSKAFSSAEAVDMISNADAEEMMEPLLIALRAADDESVLIKASPEHRIFAKEFLARIKAPKTDDCFQSLEVTA